MLSGIGRIARRVPAWVDVRLLRWRTGTPEGQRAVFAALLIMAGVLFVISWVDYPSVPAVWFLLPVLGASVMLRHRYLLGVVGVVVLLLTASVARESIESGMTGARISTLVAMALAVVTVLFESSRNRSGLPSALSEAMLADLRDRLQAQGKVPPLPVGWQSQSAVASAGGGRYAGDFLVANLSDDETHLEMILVDVCGKGVAAGTQSLQFAGALGGLIGALPPVGLFVAANDFLLRQRWDEGFATAVHVVVELSTGRYSIISAGHPPAMIWSATDRRWEVDEARGIALGITEKPDFHCTHGVLGPGDALMFYTDGVVESKARDVTSGVAWLQETARDAVRLGFGGAPRRILSKVAAGDDDRAILILCRELIGTITGGGGTSTASPDPTTGPASPDGPREPVSPTA